jgi:hypothetical protein
MRKKGITVNKLAELCREQKKLGNGNKQILISDDDEGNGFHTLYYGFSPKEKIFGGEYPPIAHDNNENDDIIVLG